jgi:1,4-dihydroxy-2-naphthoate octaprenyltransferase
MATGRAFSNPFVAAVLALGLIFCLVAALGYAVGNRSRGSLGLGAFYEGIEVLRGWLFGSSRR